MVDVQLAAAKQKGYFNGLLRELEGGKTFETIIREYHENAVGNEIYDVECIGNEVYEDQDLYDFLEQIGTTIEDFGTSYALIRTDKGKYYQVPYENRANRFGDDLPEETILFFDVDRIHSVEYLN